jgi:hypothetical protein
VPAPSTSRGSRAFRKKLAQRCADRDRPITVHRSARAVAILAGVAEVERRGGPRSRANAVQAPGRPHRGGLAEIEERNSVDLRELGGAGYAWPGRCSGVRSGTGSPESPEPEGGAPSTAVNCPVTRPRGNQRTGVTHTTSNTATVSPAAMAIFDWP